MVASTHSWLHVAAGRPDRWRHWGVLNCGFTIIALLCGLRYGAIGVAASYAILAYLITAFPRSLYAGRPLGIRTRDVLAGCRASDSLCAGDSGIWLCAPTDAV